MKNLNRFKLHNSASYSSGFFVKCFAAMFLLFFTLNINSQWTAMSSGTSQLLTSINFHGRTTGYSVGFNNTICRTTNGGSNWAASTVHSGNNYLAVWFTSDNTGYVAGTNGKIIKTDGVLWLSLSSGTTNDIRAITFVNNNTGFIAGDNVLLKTTNAGLNWDYALSDQLGANYYYSIDFVNANTGYVCGYTDNVGYMSKTTDGGADWNWQSLPVGLTELRCVKFKDANTGVAVGNNGKIIRTINGGTNWTFANCSNTDMFYSVSCGANAPFYLNYSWFAVGANGRIFKSTDNGANFYSVTSGVNTSLYEVECVSKDTIYVCGQNGTILRSYNGGGNFTSVQNTNNQLPSEFSLEQNYPNPFNPSTKVNFSVPEQSHVKITVYDALGKSVKILVDEQMSEGNYSVSLDAQNLPGGVYFYRMEANEFTQTRKMVLVK